MSLTIRHQLVRDKTGVHLSELKTKGSRRTLHLSAPLVDLLERHHHRQGAEALVRGEVWRNSEQLIFTSTLGTFLDPEDFGKRISAITKRAGLGHWSIHELRHTCASLLFAADVSLDAVADQLGHSSIHVTKDVYVHLLPGSRAKTSKAVEELLYKDYLEVISPVSKEDDGGLARRLARPALANENKDPLTRDLVGRPGLDPGTLCSYGFVK